MKKAIILIVILVFVLAAGSAMKLFVIGEPADGDTLAIEVHEQEGQVTIYIDSLDSAMAISNMSYRYEGTVMYMTVRKVLASPIHNDGSMCLYYEIVDETEIWLGGKLIWTSSK